MMGTILFRNASVLDGTGAEPFAGDVLVEGNRIADVRAAGGLRPPPGAQAIDCGGLTLMPGMVEPHAHLSFIHAASPHAFSVLPPEEHLLLTIRHAKLYLDQGFTSCFSAGATKPRLDVAVRDAIRSGDIPGPRLLAASRQLTVTCGIGDVRQSHHDPGEAMFTRPCDGPIEFRKAAREACRDGVDIIKINPSGDTLNPRASSGQTVMAEDEMAAATEVAAQHDKRVAAHARSAESVKMCLRHGVEVIYHASHADPEARDMLEAQKHRVFVAPTLGVTYTRLHEAGKFGLPLDDSVRERISRDLEAAVECMVDLRRRGVRVLPGGDYGVLWNPHGRNARDLEYFVELLGFTPMEAIVAATRWGGEIMGLPGELGQVGKGFLADVILVNGNPLADLAILQNSDRLVAIMKDGAFHKPPPADLAKRHAAA